MLRLLAIAPQDGWAFLETDDGVRLVRPPYVRTNSTPVARAVVQRAVAQHGFTALERDFADWKDLIVFLNQQVRDSRRAYDREVETQGLGKQMLELAPDEVLDQFLARVESEWLPQGLWDPAERLLTDMLHLAPVRDDPSRLSRVSDLLSRTVEGRKNAQQQRQCLGEDGNGIAAKFPDLAKRYGEGPLHDFNQRITERGQVLCVGE